MTDPSRVLVFNAGSSSLKVELFTRRPWRSQLRADAERVGRPTSVLRIDGREPKKTAELATHGEAAELILERMRGDVHGASAGGDDMLITAHRFVHGGASFKAPVVVTSPIMARLDALASLAPLHNPASLAVMRVVRARLSDVPMVAVFDTAFFRDLPEHVRGYAIPWTWRRRYQVERYGFHGIAHEYLYRRYRALTGTQRGRDRVITLQLGQGCSAAALLDGRAIETSMGFTPLEGLIMGTRPGDLDAGVILHLARQGFSWQALEDALNHESGLLGLSGASDDVRELLSLEAAGRRGAAVTLAAFCHRIHKYLGAYAAVLGGIDALVFGGGIGENAPVIRSRVCAALTWLGLELDEDANTRCVASEQRISTPSSAIDVYVIPVREEEAIAHAALAGLAGRPTEAASVR